MSNELDVFLSASFWSRVASIDDCWLWVGYRTWSGYGRMRYKGGTVAIHRLTYTALVGDIPEGLVIDHLCRVRNCFNPDHLEAVSNGENVLRGTGFAARNARKTYCPQGHPYTLDNLVNPSGVLRGEMQHRLCRTCSNKRRLERYHREKGNKKVTFMSTDRSTDE